MLKTKFITLCQNFSKDKALISLLWQEIQLAYSKPTRYYHTLKHLEEIYKELQSFKPEFDGIPSVELRFLERFLDKERIYESRYFYDKYERQARVNILMEYDLL